MTTASSVNLAVAQSRVHRFFHDLTTQGSLLGQFALLLCAVFIVSGHWVFWLVHTESVPFQFFLPCLAVMLVYACFYGGFVTRQSGFYGGAFSARFVMRTIACVTGLSLAADNAAMLYYGWAQDLQTSWVLSVMVVVVVIVFSLVYGVYASSSQDLWTDGRKRRGSGRRTIIFLTGLTAAMFGYHAYLGAVARDWVNSFLGGLAGVSLACGVCIFCYLLFQRGVNVSQDRGYKVD
jgi:small-conductance mechanosensitive channel